MRKLVLVLMLLSILLFGCNSVRTHETAEILSTDNVAILNEKSYCVVHNNLYSLNNNSLNLLLTKIWYKGVHDSIGNVYSNGEILIVINHYRLYFLDENLEALYQYRDYKTSSLKWVLLDNKLIFLDDDIDCRNLVYFDIAKKQKGMIYKNVKKDTLYTFDGNNFYVDSNFEINHIKDDVNYTIGLNNVSFYCQNYGEVNLFLMDDELKINNKSFEVGSNLCFFHRLECHKDNVYFALYDNKCGCNKSFNCICKYNNLLVYKYDLKDKTLDKISAFTEQTYVISFLPFVYYSNGKVILENNKFIDFDVKTGEEYTPYADDLNSYKRKYYSIVFHDNQIYVLSL